MAVGALRLLAGLEVKVDLDLVADDETAGFEGDVPGQAVVLAVELEVGAVADDLVAPGRPAAAVVLGLEGDRSGDVADGQVAGDTHVAAGERLDPGRAEGDRRPLLGVEE